MASAGLTAAIIGPPLFHAHLLDTGHPPDSPEIVHIERAFADASMISLTVGLLVALAASLGISWYLTRRIGHPVELLTQAAGRLSRGDYDARVTVTGGGPGVSALGDTVKTAQARAYEVAEGIDFAGRQMRRDIGWRAIQRKKK